jgi:hypothetical protein
VVFKKVRHRWRTPSSGGRRFLGMYFETVDWATPMPNLSSSPWMRGAPHVGLSLAILTMSHLRVLCRPADSCRFPPPPQPEARAVPAHHRLGPHEHQHVAPPDAESAHQHPEASVRTLQLRSRRGSSQHGELLAQHNVLRHQLRSACNASVKASSSERKASITRESSPVSSISGARRTSAPVRQTRGSQSGCHFRKGQGLTLRPAVSGSRSSTR